MDGDSILWAMNLLEEKVFRKDEVVEHDYGGGGHQTPACHLFLYSPTSVLIQSVSKKVLHLQMVEKNQKEYISWCGNSMKFKFQCP